MVSLEELHGGERIQRLQTIADREALQYKEGQRYIYFIEAQTLGLIKIGWTHNVKRRLMVLQIDCPVPVKLLGKMKETDEITEGKIHRIFKSARARGEWFKDCEELRRYIAEHKMGRR